MELDNLFADALAGDRSQKRIHKLMNVEEMFEYLDKGGKVHILGEDSSHFLYINDEGELVNEDNRKTVITYDVFTLNKEIFYSVGTYAVEPIKGMLKLALACGFDSIMMDKGFVILLAPGRYVPAILIPNLTLLQNCEWVSKQPRDISEVLFED